MPEKFACIGKCRCRPEVIQFRNLPITNMNWTSGSSRVIYKINLFVKMLICRDYVLNQTGLEQVSLHAPLWLKRIFFYGFSSGSHSHGFRKAAKLHSGVVELLNTTGHSRPVGPPVPVTRGAAANKAVVVSPTCHNRPPTGRALNFRWKNGLLFCSVEHKKNMGV